MQCQEYIINRINVSIELMFLSNFLPATDSHYFIGSIVHSWDDFTIEIEQMMVNYHLVIVL
jgi:hypothetical protein